MLKINLLSKSLLVFPMLLGLEGFTVQSSQTADVVAPNTEIAIIDGAAYPSDNTGVMLLSRPTADPKDDPNQVITCSGSLVRKDWILTARHCLEEKPFSVSPQSITAITATGSQGSQGSQIILHPNLDAALLRLNTPLRVDAPWVNAPAIATIQHLLSPTLPSPGSQVKCWGYGLYRDRYNPGGSGELRYGVFRVLGLGTWTSRNGYRTDGFSIQRNGEAPRYEQITIFGDSGGPCLETSYEGKLTGVISSVSVKFDRPEAYMVGIKHIRDWIAGQLIRFGSSGGLSQQPSQWIDVEKAGINSHSGGGAAWCPNGSFINAIDLDAAPTSAYDSPVIGAVSCGRLTGAESNRWASSQWVKVEQAGIKSHSGGRAPWCPNGSFITQIDLDGAPISAHDSPVIGQVRCASLAGYSRWSSTTDWLEIGPILSHNQVDSWCPSRSFITQIDLDGASTSAHDSPVIGRVKCSYPTP